MVGPRYDILLHRFKPRAYDRRHRRPTGLARQFTRSSPRLTVADSIRLGQSTAPHAVGGNTAESAAFLGGLHPEALATGRRLGHPGWLDGCRDIVDVGGGSRGLALSLQEHLPQARVRVLEQPNVAIATRQFLAAADNATIEVIEADVVADGVELDASFRPPCDGVVCCALLQVLAPEDAARAVRRMVDWLAPGGCLVVLGMGVLAADRVTPRDVAVHNIIFGTLYDGRAYTVTEYRSWMRAAGLSQIENVWLDDGRGALRGIST